MSFRVMLSSKRLVMLSAAKHLLLGVGFWMLVPHTAGAQSDGDLHLRRLLALPVGALPPVASLMPASRNHNYLVLRAQGGRLTGSAGDRDAVGLGVDIQWRGGSSFGGTVGYQRGECAVSDECPDHVMFGGRARLNLLTGGPTFAAIIGDASATTTVGADIGFGYAPNAYSGRNACAVDIGAPVSLAMFQRLRVVSFFSPGVAWDVGCPTRGSSEGLGMSYTASAGIGLHQLWHPGLDVTIGAQRIFRPGAGVHLGIGVTYVRLP